MGRVLAVLLMLMTGHAVAQPVRPRVEQLPDVIPPRPNVAPLETGRSAMPVPESREGLPTVIPPGPPPPRNPWLRRPLPEVTELAPWPAGERVAEIPVPAPGGRPSGQLRLR